MIGIELLTFLRFIIPTLLLFAMVLVARLPFPPRRVIKPIIIRGLCIAACQLCFIASLNTLSLVESSVLFSTGPLFIAVLERLFFNVHIRTETKLGLGATFIGVVLLAGDVTGIQFKPELLLGLAAGLFSAGSQVSLFRASKKEVEPSVLNSWTFLIAALAVLPLSFFSGLSESDVHIVIEPHLHIIAWLCLFVLSISVVANQIFRSKAYRLAESGSQLAPLIFTSLLFTAIWQLLFFDETYSTYQIAGITLIIVAALLNKFATKLFRFLFQTQARHA